MSGPWASRDNREERQFSHSMRQASRRNAGHKLVLVLEGKLSSCVLRRGLAVWPRTEHSWVIHGGSYDVLEYTFYINVTILGETWGWWSQFLRMQHLINTFRCHYTPPSIALLCAKVPNQPQNLTMRNPSPCRQFFNVSLSYLESWHRLGSKNKHAECNSGNGAESIHEITLLIFHMFNTHNLTENDSCANNDMVQIFIGTSPLPIIAHMKLHEISGPA